MSVHWPLLAGFLVPLVVVVVVVVVVRISLDAASIGAHSIAFRMCLG